MKALLPLILALGVLAACDRYPPEQENLGLSADSAYRQYMTHREEALKMAPEDLSLIGQPNRTLAYGVVLDVPTNVDIVTTQFAYSNGDAGFYNSDGAYFLSEGDSLAGVKAQQLVQEAIGMLDRFVRTDSMELPTYDSLQFFLLTSEGRYRLRLEKEGEYHHPLEQLLQLLPSLKGLNAAMDELRIRRAHDQARADSINNAVDSILESLP